MMMNTPLKSLISVLIMTPFLTSSALATEDKNAEFGLELEAGLENSSQLYLDSIEQTSTSGDTATLLSVKAKAKLKPTSKLSFNSFYSINNKDFKSNDAFDQNTHLAYLDAAYDLSLIKIGADISQADVELQGASFLSLKQSSYNLSKLFSNHVYLRLQKRQQTKRFTGLDERNADNQAFLFDGFNFFDQGQSFFNFGLSDESETANDTAFDFSGKSYWLKLSKGFEAFGGDNKFQIGWKRINKNYAEESQSLVDGLESEAMARADTQTTLEFKWLLPLSDNVELISQAEMSRNQSNYEQAKFDAKTFALSIRATF
jgi:hypothetical protein